MMKVSASLTEKELNRKRQIRAPLEIGQTCIGILTMNEITKSGLKRFYLYTQDQETLIIASEFHNFTEISYHQISLSSTTFLPKDQHCLGVLVSRQSSSTKIGRLNHFADQTRREACISIRMHREYEIPKHTMKSGESKIRIRMLPHSITDVEDDYSMHQKAFSHFPKFYPEVKFIESKNNVLFVVKNQHCFSFAQLYDEEYFFAVSYPLSIFQGFCIAAAILT